MDTNTPTPTIAAANLTSVSAQNRNLGIDSKRMAVGILGQTDIRECMPVLINRENVL